MIAHIVIGIILLIIGIISWRYGLTYFKYDVLAIIIGTIAFLASVIILLCGLLSYLDYTDFEIEYEIQREMLANYDLPEDENSLVYIVDLLEINQKLAEYQASRLHWGDWSCIPERVLELEPIGP